MRHQHTIDDQILAESSPPQGIVVPLDLPSLKIVSQALQSDGSIEVQVRATTDREACPHCQKICVKIHDTRARGKRDIALREYQVRLVIWKRRFRCLACRRTFTETENVCGKYKRTTKRFRDYLAKQASEQPIASVAQQAKVGPRFVQECLESLVEEHLAQEGRTVNETAKLPTPCFC